MAQTNSAAPPASHKISAVLRLQAKKFGSVAYNGGLGVYVGYNNNHDDIYSPRVKYKMLVIHGPIKKKVE